MLLNIFRKYIFDLDHDENLNFSKVIIPNPIVFVSVKWLHRESECKMLLMLFSVLGPWVLRKVFRMFSQLSCFIIRFKKNISPNVGS